MEDVLEVYHAPYDAAIPLVCMDESSKQLVGEVHAPIPVRPGHGQILDHEYVRNGVADIFMAVEPLAGVRHVAIWEQDRNNHGSKVNWRFTTDDARIKLARLYPKI
ncbi:MAG: hypothetical protein WC360_06205 [Opitutales bacterium]